MTATATHETATPKTTTDKTTLIVGGEPQVLARDFADYARAAAASGVWNG